MNRRQFLQRSSALFGGMLCSGSLLDPGWLAAATSHQPFTRPLPIPPLLEKHTGEDGVSRFQLTAQNGKANLISERLTPTMGYNGNYLGPTIRVRNGESVAFTVNNTLDQTTTVHWHGLHVPAEFDGGPHQPIAPGTSWHPHFTIKQQAATLWYHPHAMGLTGEHVYMGLAGLLYIEDEISDSLEIPKEYGVNDIPLVLQDRRMYEDGSLAYVRSMMDVMHGVIGNILLVNGVEMPIADVPAGLVRLRVLNGSNSTIYRIGFGDGRTFDQIATDGGFLEQPVSLNELLLSPGERAEILVDFRTDKESPSLMVDQLPGGSYMAMRFRVAGANSQRFAVPETLTSITWLREEDAVRTRHFAMQTFSESGPLAINGRHMDMARIDEKVELNTTEIWEISNVSRRMMQMPHSMHLHDVQFQILDRNGRPPAPQEKGRKDTVLILPGETVRIIAHFADYTGIYMYHCHLLEHEDRGMMGQFEVVETTSV